MCQCGPTSLARSRGVIGSSPIGGAPLTHERVLAGTCRPCPGAVRVPGTERAPRRLLSKDRKDGRHGVATVIRWFTDEDRERMREEKRMSRLYAAFLWEYTLRNARVADRGQQVTPGLMR